jgi:hypothetical protein
LLTGNSASATDSFVPGDDRAYGGAYGGALNNCTLTRNLAFIISDHFGGPANGEGSGAMNNCILFGNTNQILFGNTNQSFCQDCYYPGMLEGGNNWYGDPLFVDTNGWANLRLQSNSPCINAGNNSYITSATDLDGNPRIAGGTVDIGAYEFQSPASTISYAWLQRYGLPINALTDTADPDGDGVDNYHEWLAGSDPTNPFSFPPLLTLIPYGANVILTWPTNAVGCTLQSTTNLVLPAVWSTNSPAPIIIGGDNVVIDFMPGPQQFYRLSQ